MAGWLGSGLFLFLLAFFPLVFSATPAGASCDIAIGTPYTEDAGTATVTRVIVSGEASGSGFNADTRTQINCNSGNAKPAPLNTLVEAGKSAYTSSSLPYRGYCEYPPVTSDTTYSIGATLLPHNVPCKANGPLEVKIEGSGAGKATEAPTATPATTPMPTQATAATPAPAPRPTTAPTPTTGTGKVQPTPDDGPALLDIPGAIHQVFRPGWSIIGIKAAGGKLWDGCSGGDWRFRVYFFNAATQRFEKAILFDSDPRNLRGRGMAVKTPESCAITIEKPSYLSAQTLQLAKGWNLVSVQTEGDAFPDIFDRLKVRNGCDITGGPWRYDREAGKYVKERGFVPGVGYWVKAAGACSISVSQDAPPELPGN